MTELLKVLMEREDCSENEAQEMIDDMREQIEEGEDPEEVLFEYGLEPDYLFDLI